MLGARASRSTAAIFALLAVALVALGGGWAPAADAATGDGVSGSARVLERRDGGAVEKRLGSFGPSAPAATPTPSPTPTPVPPHDVRLAVGDDFQRAVDLAPEGTRFLVARGVHRLQSVVPKNGMSFVGEAGAVLSGARVLPAGSFTRDGSRWFIGGQSQQGPFDANLAKVRMLSGFDVEERVEELFSNSQRLRRVGSLAQVAAGTWFFDHAAQRIWVGQDPATLGLIETSVSLFAFGANGVRNVTIENLVLEKYATPAQFGAVGGWHQHHTMDWKVRNVEARDNHGAGIRIGPGMTVEGSKIHRNGQIGLAGDGRNGAAWLPGAGYSAPVTVRGNEITNNRLLNYDWGWEGGGTKFKYVTGMVLENNWVHDNRGPGLWWDIDNRNVVVRGNLVEHNDQAGIFYEISYGTTDIFGNIVRGNGRRGVGHEGAGIDISSSSNVTVRHNAVYDNRQGVLVRKDSRNWDTANVVVHSNDIKMTTGFTGFRDDINNPAYFTSKGNRFTGNTYRLDSQTNTSRFLWQYTWRSAAGWRSGGQDTDGRFLDASGTPTVPAGIPTYTPTTYGTR